MGFSSLGGWDFFYETYALGCRDRGRSDTDKFFGKERIRRKANDFYFHRKKFSEI
jgi:hypothetical protein